MLKVSVYKKWWNLVVFISAISVQFVGCVCIIFVKGSTTSWYPCIANRNFYILKATLLIVGTNNCLARYCVFSNS